MSARAQAIIGNAEGISTFKNGNALSCNASQLLADEVVDHGAGGFLDPNIHGHSSLKRDWRRRWRFKSTPPP